MPLTLTTPEVRPVLDTVRIEGFSVEQINEDNGPAVDVRVSYGVIVDGLYSSHETEIIRLVDGAAIIARMNAPIPADSTLYAEIKAALYDLLLARGHIGAGTVK